MSSSDTSNPEVSESARPSPGDLNFEIQRTLSSILAIRTTVPDDALTALILGVERAGYGVLINDQGVIATAGYLVTEADSVWLIDDGGRTLPGHVVGYDPETGFGVVQALRPLDLPAMEIGSVANLDLGDRVIVAAHGGLKHAMNAEVSSKREFAGYWEYVLDEAIFTAPAHPSWGGSALIGMDGNLYGIGSLMVQEVGRGGDTSDCNMFIPMSLLRPVLDDLLMYGRPNKPPRPWLGVFVYDVGEHLVIAGVYKDCPAHRARLQPGDVLLELAGQPILGLAQLFRGVWALGPAGVTVPLTVMRDSEHVEVTVHSTDRNDCLKSAPLH